MKAIGIENVTAGMILERPVKNHQGVLLMEAGNRISERSIRIFKSWGVAEVHVKGAADRSAEGAGPPPPINVTEETRLKAKFADVWDDPVMVAIFNAARRLLIKDCQDSEGGDGQTRA